MDIKTVAELKAELKDRIESANSGENNYLLSWVWSTLDASDIATYCTIIGYTVVDYRDNGRNGLCTLANGVKLSTNGYIYK